MNFTQIQLDAIAVMVDYVNLRKSLHGPVATKRTAVMAVMEYQLREKMVFVSADMLHEVARQVGGRYEVSGKHAKIVF